MSEPVTFFYQGQSEGFAFYQIKPMSLPVFQPAEVVKPEPVDTIIHLNDDECGFVLADSQKISKPGNQRSARLAQLVS